MTLDEAVSKTPSRMTTTGLPARALSSRSKIGADQQAGNRALQKQPKITPVNVAAGHIKGRGDQAQHAGENERRAHGGGGRQSDDEHQRGNREAAAADAGEAHRQRNEKSNDELHQSTRFESVWMPHSSFAPPQRPERGSAPSSGIAVQGSQPMLR